jgi:hypothetical protein
MKLKLKNVQPVLVMGVGAIAGGFITNKIPVGNDKVKNAIVAVGGILLSGSKGMLGHFGAGLAVGAIKGLGQSFGIGDPNGGYLAGMDNEFISATETAESASGYAGTGQSDGNY